MMMWRLVLLGVACRHTNAESSSNTDTNSRSKFPVQVEADVGAPKPGEGQGGVAVLLKPMPEATTMKTWSFLKESMLKIGDQVSQIMQVRNDIAMLQQDLTMQEKLWKNAEVTLNEENAKLKAETEALKKQVQAGMQIKRDLMAVQQSLEEEQRRSEDLDNEARMQEKKWQMEVKFLDDRKNNVTALHRKVNETASKEISRALEVQLQLQKDGATLQLALQNFKDRFRNKHEKADYEDAKSKQEQAELRRQITAMKEGLQRIQGKLKPRHVFDNEEMMLKNNLDKETSTIINLQSEQQQLTTQCSKEMQGQDAIKCNEEAHFQARNQEKTQFCNGILVQNQVLRQDLAKCGIMTKVYGTPLQAPAPALPPLAPAVPLRDDERLIPMPPAAAPAAPGAPAAGAPAGAPGSPALAGAPVYGAPAPAFM